MEIELAVSFLLLLALTFLATVDMAFGQLSDVGLRRVASEAEEHPAARSTPFLTEILENRARFSFSLSATIQILLVAFAVLVTYISVQWFSESSLALFISLLSGLLLAGIFRQFIPRLISLRNPEGKLLRLLPVLRPFYRALTFAAEPWHRSIHSAIEFGDTRVSEVMTPRTEIVALPKTATVREARNLMIESRHSRLPVYRDQIDNVEGIIYVRDLLPSLATGKADSPIAPFIRQVYLVPETKPVAKLLRDMQKAHAYLAMVIDEYGGIAGLVTVEDILEEIVGEIEDEDISGEEPEEIVASADGAYEVLGGTEIGKIERLFGMEIEADDFTTIAGLVIAQKGSVPRPGEHLSFRGLEVDILDADEKRICRLKLRRKEEAQAEDATANR